MPIRAFSEIGCKDIFATAEKKDEEEKNWLVPIKEELHLHLLLIFLHFLIIRRWKWKCLKIPCRRRAGGRQHQLEACFVHLIIKHLPSPFAFLSFLYTNDPRLFFAPIFHHKNFFVLGFYDSLEQCHRQAAIFFGTKTSRNWCLNSGRDFFLSSSSCCPHFFPLKRGGNPISTFAILYWERKLHASELERKKAGFFIAVDNIVVAFPPTQKNIYLSRDGIENDDDISIYIPRISSRNPWYFHKWLFPLQKRLTKVLQRCDFLIFFAGRNFSRWQKMTEKFLLWGKVAVANTRMDEECEENKWNPNPVDFFSSLFQPTARQKSFSICLGKKKFLSFSFSFWGLQRPTKQELKVDRKITRFPLLEFLSQLKLNSRDEVLTL